MSFTFRFYIFISVIVSGLIFFGIFMTLTNISYTGILYYALVAILFTILLMLFISKLLAHLALKGYRNAIDATRAVIKGGSAPLTGYPDELLQLMQQIQTLSETSTETLAKANHRQDNITQIINSMEDGLLLLDESFIILFANKAGLDVFNIARPKRRRSFVQLYRNQRLTITLHNLKDTGPQVLDIEKGQQTYRIHLSMAQGGYTILTKNVTDIIRLEQLQRQFSANVSHALKTPVTSIIGFSELMHRGMVTDSEKITEHSFKIYTEAQRLMSLIDDMLRLAHMENNEIKELEQINVTEIVTASLDMYASKIAEKNIQVTVTGAGYAKIKYSHMLEVVTNLLDNAIKYNHNNGRIDINITEDRQEGQRAKLRLSIKDTGIGINESKVPFIFERFYRVPSTVAGNGLGLSIVETIVQLYKGSVSVESDGEGSLFTVVLRV